MWRIGSPGTPLAVMLDPMRLVAMLLAALLVGGCATNTYEIPHKELVRLAQTPPEARGNKVRVVQEIGSGTTVADTQEVGPQTQIIFMPRFTIFTSPRYDRRRGHLGHGGGGITHSSGGGGGGGSADDGKALAIAVIVIAAVGLFVLAGVEGSRYDGFVQLHPMHPVHLIGKDGSYTVMPLAWIDPDAAAWTDKAIVRPNDGPWHELGRAPLTRWGGTLGLYGGTGTLRSARGDNGAGPAFTIQGGYFFNQYIGLMGDIMFAWRANATNDTLFESRYMLELQMMPLQLGILHAGGYVAGGLAYRLEDGVAGGNDGSTAYSAGGQLQLDVNTRIAITARLGVTKAHEASGFGLDRMTDLIFGLSVY